MNSDLENTTIKCITEYGTLPKLLNQAARSDAVRCLLNVRKHK